MTESLAKCELCRNAETLVDSHVIPKFVYRWLKETGGTDYLRFGGAPNRRVQDGIKHKMLCIRCEQILSKYEKIFSERVFSLLNTDSFPKGNYGDWLCKFATSLVWRVLKSQETRGILNSADASLKKQIEAASEHWRKFLIGEARSPENFEIHMVPVGQLSNIEHRRTPHNWNRYTLRMVEFDLVFSENYRFIAAYAKIGPVAFFGHIKNDVQPWKGSRIAVSHGSFKINRIIWPPMVLNFFFDRAKGSDEINSQISDKQRAISEDSVLKNIDRMAISDQFKAMLKDADRFGIDSISYKPKGKS